MNSVLAGEVPRRHLPDHSINDLFGESVLCAHARSGIHSKMEVLNALARRNAALIKNHPFVQRCARGEVSLSALKIFLGQHGIYGAYFTRYLCAVMANLDNGDDVLHLTQNLVEELGRGDEANEPHSMIYKRMLRSFDIDLKRTATLPATQALINTMFDYCKRNNPAYGLAALCLGAESIVPDLYRNLMSGMLAAGIEPDRLEFFRIHIECDDGHGEIMQGILARILARDPLQECAIHEAATRTIDARLEFFSNIERAAL